MPYSWLPKDGQGLGKADRKRWQATIDEDLDSDELFEHLVQTAATEAPTGKLVTFLEVEFLVSGVQGVIQSLEIDPAVQADHQRRSE